MTEDSEQPVEDKENGIDLADAAAADSTCSLETRQGEQPEAEPEAVSGTPPVNQEPTPLEEPPHSPFVNLTAREAVTVFMSEERTITVKTVVVVVVAVLALIALLVFHQMGIGIIVFLVLCTAGTAWSLRARFSHFEQLGHIVDDDCDPLKMLGVINILLDEDLLAANHTQLQYQRAMCLARLGRSDEAITQIDLLVAKEGAKGDGGLTALEIRAEAYCQTHDREGLEAVYDQARTLLDESREGSEEQGRISRTLELADERLALLDKEYNHCRRQLQLVLASNPNPQQRATAEYRLGEVEEASGDVVEASKHYAYAALHGGTLAVQSEAETKLVGASTAGEATGAGITMAMPRLVIEDVPPEDAL
jgi:hypothetical protein